MASLAPLDGDQLVRLLGRVADDDAVQDMLKRYARGVQPELDPDDDEVLVDWILINEIGLELGFEDEAYVHARDPGLRRQGPLLLSQLYFYCETDNTRAFPYRLPFGLCFRDDRNSARAKLSEFEGIHRSNGRDAWQLSEFNLVVAYSSGNRTLESVFCYLRYEPWPDIPTVPDAIRALAPEFFVSLFGLRWSSAELRQRLELFGYERSIGEARSEGAVDLRVSFGLKLLFAPSGSLAGANSTFPRSPTFAGVTYYSSRHEDAREWPGQLPLGLAFSDTQTELKRKVGRGPDEQEDENLSGNAVWRFPKYTLDVFYSNLENRILSLSLLAPGFGDDYGDFGQDDESE